MLTAWTLDPRHSVLKYLDASVVMAVNSFLLLLLRFHSRWLKTVCDHDAGYVYLHVRRHLIRDGGICAVCKVYIAYI